MNHQDNTFVRNILIVIAILVLLAVVLAFAARNMGSQQPVAQSTDERRMSAVEERIRPVGQVRVGEGGPAVAVERSGQQIVEATCQSCHGTGALGAPRMGEKGDWAPRLQQKGAKDLLANAIGGIGAMPPKGGDPTLSDEDVQKAVAFMLDESKVAHSFGKTAQAKQAEPAQQPVQQPAQQPAQAAPQGGADVARGQQVHTQACFACHGTGAAGAPKTGDAAAWQARIAQGMPTLVEHAINGIRGMPPKGGRPDLSNEDVEAAVAYMVQESK